MKQFHDPEWRARHQEWPPVREMANIGGVEAVHVFGRIDCFDHRLRINAAGQWQLHKYAVDIGVVVQASDHAEQLLRRGVGLQANGPRVDPCLTRRPILGAHIDLAGWILADQDNRETRHEAGSGDFRRDFGTQGGGDSLAVDDAGHRISNLAVNRAGSPVTRRVLSRLV
jgi:hypothetical protein